LPVVAAQGMMVWPAGYHFHPPGMLAQRVRYRSLDRFRN